MNLPDERRALRVLRSELVSKQHKKLTDDEVLWLARHYGDDDPIAAALERLRQRNQLAEERHARSEKRSTITKRIRVPSLPVLARKMELTMRDYKIVYTKEFSNWCMNYTAYFVALGKDKPGGPYSRWHNAACRMARKTLEN
jgi:hypothetical protein